MTIASKKQAHSRGLLLGALFSALLVSASGIQAQAFKVQGGSSSLLDAHGGSVEIRANRYTGKVAVGFMDGARFGFSLTTPFHGWIAALGDQAIPFSLPTDVFTRSYYFLGRGAGLTRKTHTSKLFLYGGVTSRGFYAPFLQAAEAETGAGLIFYERRLTPQLRFQSNNLFSRKQTFLQSLEWTARDDTKLGLTGGVGSNEPYWSTSLNFTRHRIGLLASYARAGNSFRRVQVESPALAETDRENIRFEVVPVRDVRVFVSRQNYLSPDASRERATVNGLGAGANIEGYQVHGSLFDSSSIFGSTLAMSMGVRKSFWRRLDASLDFLATDPERGDGSQNVVSTFRETITPRLSLSQMVTHGNGQTGFAFGGNFLSNRLTAGVEYQTVYVPFGSSGAQFRQVLMVNMRMQLPKGIELNGASHVNPLGQVRYTAYGSGFAYRGGYGLGAAPALGTFHRYVVRGYVLEENGEPVRGAALRIGEELVFTDSQGAFFARHKKDGEYRVTVAFEEFILPGAYEVAEMPPVIRSEKEDAAPWYEIRLKRVRNPAPGASAREEQNGGDVPKNETLVHLGTDLPITGRPVTRFLSSGSALKPLATRLPKNSSKVSSSGHAASTKLRPSSGKRSTTVRKRKPVKRTVKSKRKRNPPRATARNRGNPSKPAARPASGKRTTSRPHRAGKQLALRHGTKSPGNRPSGNR